MRARKSSRALVAAEQIGDAAQQAIARFVTERIVDALEQIDVPNRERQRLRVALPALEFLFEPPLVGVAAVRARQRVDHEPRFLLGANLDQLVGLALELRDFFAQLGCALLVLGLPALFIVPKFESWLATVSRRDFTFVFKYLEIRREHDLLLQRDELGLHRVLEVERVVAAALRYTRLPACPVLEFGELLRHLLEKLLELMAL